MKPNQKFAKKKRAPRGGKNTMSLTSPEFQEKVTRLDKLMQLAVAPTPKAPPGFVLLKDEQGGTLEQVGREADNAWAGVKRIMSLLNVEGKAFDNQFTIAPLSNSGALTNISLVTQGVGDNQRTGDSLRFTRIRVKVQITYGSAATTGQIVLGRSKDGPPVIADIMDTLGTGYAGLTFENHDQRKSDVWLVHRTFVTDSVNRPVQTIELELPRLGDGEKNSTTYVNATTSVSANCYWLAFVCGAGGGAGPTLVVQTRSNFVDN